ncbi:Phospholipid scramblase 4 [Trichoplax sp. H2]|nr:Phospholipid scramblase 4 [Trichoplax sp. H2]|eukprot:RDD36913.1 Phospholipid scramblase 4 [Trichoplax sp. H2]
MAEATLPNQSQPCGNNLLLVGSKQSPSGSEALQQQQSSIFSSISLSSYQVIPPVTHQPGSEPENTVAWTPPAQQTQDCPSGLEYLINLDKVLIKQQPDPLEMKSYTITPDRFIIKNKYDQQVFLGVEGKHMAYFLTIILLNPNWDSDFLKFNLLKGEPRQTLDIYRPIILKAYDRSGLEVFKVYRGSLPVYSLCSCSASSSVKIRLTFESPPGTLLYYLWPTSFKGHYYINDINGKYYVKVINKIKRKQFLESPPTEFNFDIYNYIENCLIGTMKKKWLGHQALSHEHSLEIDFLIDSPPGLKACIIAIGMLYDFIRDTENRVFFSKLMLLVIHQSR